MESSTKSNRIWIAVFISSFLSLVVDGMDLQFLSLSLPSLISEFHLTKLQAGAIGTYSLIGMGIGGIVGGWVSDRIGRVRTASWTIVLFSLGTFALAFTQSYWQFIIFRFISALGIGSIYVVANTLMSEYVPTKKRTTILGMLQAGYSVGYLIASLLAGAIIPKLGWRPMFMVALVPVVLALYVRKVIPEPAGWQNAAKEATTRRKGEWALIFGERKVLVTFIIWTLTATCLQFGYYGVGNWLPTYLVSELHFNFTKMTGYLVGTYSAMIIGKVITGWLADRVGRKVMYMTGGLLTAVFLPFIVLYHTPGNIIILLTIFGFLYGMPFAVNATLMTESFATNVRGTAVGGAYNIGRAGAALSPIVIGLIAENKSIGFGLAFLGITYALTGLIPWFLIKEKMHEPFVEQKSIGV